MEAATAIALADLAFRAFELAMVHASQSGVTPEQKAAFLADKVARFDRAMAALEASEPPPIQPG